MPLQIQVYVHVLFLISDIQVTSFDFRLSSGLIVAEHALKVYFDVTFGNAADTCCE